MPAAAVIPAPIAYIKVVAVKKLVVEFRISPWQRPKGLLAWGVVLVCLTVYGMPFVWCAIKFRSLP